MIGSGGYWGLSINLERRVRIWLLRFFGKSLFVFGLNAIRMMLLGALLVRLLVARGSSGLAACGRIFRDSSVATFGCFVPPLVYIMLFSRWTSCCHASHQIGLSKGLASFMAWSDSQLVFMDFSSPFTVLWNLQTQLNYMVLLKFMTFICCHIFREVNHCPGKIASHGVWWNTIPNFIREDFYRNNAGLPYFQFKNWFLRKGFGLCPPCFSVIFFNIIRGSTLFLS